MTTFSLGLSNVEFSEGYAIKKRTDSESNIRTRIGGLLPDVCSVACGTYTEIKRCQHDLMEVIKNTG
jgi:hypothetical protein